MQMVQRLCECSAVADNCGGKRACEIDSIMSVNVYLQSG